MAAMSVPVKSCSIEPYVQMGTDGVIAACMPCWVGVGTARSYLHENHQSHQYELAKHLNDFPPKPLRLICNPRDDAAEVRSSAMVVSSEGGQANAAGAHSRHKNMIARLKGVRRLVVMAIRS